MFLSGGEGRRDYGAIVDAGKDLKIHFGGTEIFLPGLSLTSTAPTITAAPNQDQVKRFVSKVKSHWCMRAPLIA